MAIRIGMKNRNSTSMYIWNANALQEFLAGELQSRCLHLREIFLRPIPFQIMTSYLHSTIRDIYSHRIPHVCGICPSEQWLSGCRQLKLDNTVSTVAFSINFYLPREDLLSRNSCVMSDHRTYSLQIEYNAGYYVFRKLHKCMTDPDDSVISQILAVIS